MGIYQNGKEVSVLFGNGGVSVESISIVSEPEKRSYIVGDIFDPTGIMADITFSNGKVLSANAFELSFEPSTPLTSENDSVNASIDWGGKIVSAKQPITVFDISGNKIWWSPEMTSNTSPTPYVSSSRSHQNPVASYGAFQAFNTNSTFWNSTNAILADEFLQFDFGSPTVCFGIAMMPDPQYPAATPNTFTIYGSNDETNWEKIISCSKLPVIAVNNWREVNFDDIVMYRYYKLADFANNPLPSYRVKSIKFSVLESSVPIIESSPAEADYASLNFDMFAVEPTTVENQNES